MHTVATEVTKPSDAKAFEQMCLAIYGHVFGDPTPKFNGRSGQAQGGVDVFVTATFGLVGIQCKRLQDGTLTWDHVLHEISEADKANVPICRLVVATTAANDAKLLGRIRTLSDGRVAQGLFSVDIEFWEEISAHVRSSPKLQDSYAPLTPGAAVYRQDAKLNIIDERVESVQSMLVATLQMSDARLAVDRMLSDQLDEIKELVLNGRFRDARLRLDRLGGDLSVLDAHQRARWYQQRGICAWMEGDDDAAAADLRKAASIFPDDDRMAAAGVRGLLLGKDVAAALVAADAAIERFASSSHVWIVWANAHIINGDPISLSDAPASLRDNADVVQIAAWSHRARGQTEEALTLLDRAAALPDAGLFVKSLALSIALEVASADSVLAAHDLIPPSALKRVQAFVDVFGDIDVVLDLQAEHAQEDALVHLAYANLLLGRSDSTLHIADRAKGRGIVLPRLEFVALLALRRLDRLGDVLDRAQNQLESLPMEGLLLAAEVAAKVGVVALIDTLIARPDAQMEHGETLSGLRWLAMSRSKDLRSRAAAEIEAADLGQTSSLSLLSLAARVLISADREDLATTLIDRAVTLVGADAASHERLILADLLMASERFTAASDLYECLAPAGQHSDLHAQLLAC